MSDPIKVTVTDPKTGDVLGEHIVEDDYLLICAGTAYESNVQVYRKSGTHVVTIKNVARS